MTSKFESPHWVRPIAQIIGAADGKSVAAGLAGAIGAVVDQEGTALIAFHADARPDVLHHTLEPAGRRHYLDRYLDGPYLLDPLFQLAVAAAAPAMRRFRDESPDRFRSSEYYRRYCERTHLMDEIDFLLPVADGTTLALVVGRRHRKFSKAELGRLGVIEPIVIAAMKRIWDAWTTRSPASRGQDDVHRRLMRCFESFGESVLTERERQISQLLLRGHSSKSIARELGIAPGTVMVHKRNLFGKLEISSQYELFALLIDDLSSI